MCLLQSLPLGRAKPLTVGWEPMVTLPVFHTGHSLPVMEPEQCFHEVLSLVGDFILLDVGHVARGSSGRKANGQQTPTVSH